MVKKIVFIGRAGVGKTTIKNIIFEGADPKDLALKPLEPTRGIDHSIYKWLDLEVAIFDTSGQELAFMLGNEKEYTALFTETSLIIYVIDYSRWVSNYQNISEEIELIKEKVLQINDQTKIVIFFHKVDLINQKYKGNFKSIRNQFRELAPLLKKYPLYFTSIHPYLIWSLYNAFSNIFTSFSNIAVKLKEVIDSQISKIPKSICFITNKDNKSIVQSMTEDFNTDLIHPIQKTLSTINHSKEELKEIYRECHLIDIGRRLLSLVLDNIESVSPDLKNLFFLSETHYKDQLKVVLSSLKLELEKTLQEGGL